LLLIKWIAALFIFSVLMSTDCHNYIPPNTPISIEGFVITDALGNQIGLVGSAGVDWQLLDMSQIPQREQQFLLYPQSLDTSHTTISTVSLFPAYPSPLSGTTTLTFNASDSVILKVTVVNGLGYVLKTAAVKGKGVTSVSLDLSDNNLYPSGTSLRIYYSFSAAAQSNFKVGYGDVKVCKPNPMPYTQCF
jgi:hypothetical protein